MKRGRLFCPYLAQGALVSHFRPNALKTAKKGQKWDNEDLTIS